MSNAMIADPGFDYANAPMPPHDMVAEQAVLGAMMLSADAIGEVTEVIDVSDFYRPAHAAIYQAILALYGKGDPTDALVVSAELERRGELQRIGTANYLHTLMATVPTASNVAHYAQIVAEKATLRRVGEAGTRIQQLGYAGVQGTDEIAAILDQAQTALDTVVDDRSTNTGYTLFAEMRAERLSALDDVQAGRVEPGLPTGFLDLDSITGGWKPGQLIVVAGRPGLGKSTLAVDMARTASVKHGKTSVIFSLEMSEAELWDRIVSAEGKVRIRDMKTPHTLQPGDYDRIADALDRIESGGPLIIDDTPTTTVAQIRAKARRIKARHGLDLIVVDYLQLMTSGARAENRQVEVSEFSRQLKILAKELEVPVIALSQLNRGPEQRQDKRPMLSDLRESGALEQDADVVILVHRPEVYEDDSPRGGEADLILAKHRGGPTATVTVAQQLHYSRFADLALPQP
ncbi:replicative DNA helicase [Amycolatopsis thermoflava]|uniref:replicative DNA helicase n=1 Tax=Amycolatopsis thermoflava TaxID=84480 RepID=UPI003D709D76